MNGKAEHRPKPPRLMRVVDVQQIGDLVLHEEAVAVDLIEIDEEDLLELRGRPLEVVALDDQERRFADRVRSPIA